jgi:hypothetical protein
MSCIDACTMLVGSTIVTRLVEVIDIVSGGVEAESWHHRIAFGRLQLVLFRSVNPKTFILHDLLNP